MDRETDSESKQKNIEENSAKTEREALPTDDKKIGEWKSRYDKDAWKWIIKETIYLVALLILGLVIFYFCYTGKMYKWYIGSTEDAFVKAPMLFIRHCYCALFGFFGGTVYDMKMLYKAVAWGRWHLDRILWRIFTPWVSLILSIVIASTMSNTVFTGKIYTVIVIGFFVGYFSESAIGKLYGIAKLLFD